MRKTQASEAKPGNTSDISIPARKNPSRTLALGLTCTMLAGCAAGTDEPAPDQSKPSITSSPQQEAKSSIPMFADIQFRQAVGSTAAYDIICVYRKDISNPSIHPRNALAYYVRATRPEFGQIGFVDPSRAGLVTGTSPDCITPPSQVSKIPATVAQPSMPPSPQV